MVSRKSKTVYLIGQPTVAVAKGQKQQTQITYDCVQCLVPAVYQRENGLQQLNCTRFQSVWLLFLSQCFSLATSSQGQRGHIWASDVHWIIWTKVSTQYVSLYRWRVSSTQQVWREAGSSIRVTNGEISSASRKPAWKRHWHLLSSPPVWNVFALNKSKNPLVSPALSKQQHQSSAIWHKIHSSFSGSRIKIFRKGGSPVPWLCKQMFQVTLLLIGGWLLSRRLNHTGLLLNEYLTPNDLRRYNMRN